MADTPPPNISNLSPGEQLRKARQGYRWSVEDVAANLNLTANVVRALESGNHEELPEAIFVRGYLRAYARLMEIDESVVLTDADGAEGGSIGSVVLSNLVLTFFFTIISLLSLPIYLEQNIKESNIVSFYY